LTEEEGTEVPTEVTESNIIKADFQNRTYSRTNSPSPVETESEPEKRRWTALDALNEALRSEIDEVIIVGKKGNEKLFYNASVKSGFTAVFLLEYAKFLMTHGLFSGAGAPPNEMS